MCASKSQAGAWVQKKGEGLMINSLNWYVSTHAYDEHRHYHSSPRRREIQINPYLEYGKTDHLTVGTNIFLLDVNNKAGGSVTGLGDVELFGKYLLWGDEASVVSAQGLIKFPGNASGATPIGGGTRQIDLEAKILFGTSGRAFFSYEDFWFLDLSAAFRKRFGAPADEIRADWMLGLKTQGERLWYLLKQTNIFGLRNQTGNGPNYDLHTIEPSVMYWVKKDLGLQAGLRHDFYGRNIGVGNTGFVAVWIEF